MATRPAATPEHWTELLAARRQRRLCAEQVEAIKSSCRVECGKRHVTECGPCYGKALERMRRRYNNNNNNNNNESSPREWFTQRKAFLQELDGLFADAKRHRRSVKAIEARIESEKEAWYRWVLRRHPEFLAVRDDGAHQDELRAMLDDPERSRDQLVGMMWQGIGKPPDWAERVDQLAGRVAAAGGDATALKTVYARDFFRDDDGQQLVSHARPLLAEYEADGGPRLEEVVGRMAERAGESRRAQPLREKHRLRLADLRRAKTAFELNKIQAKSRARTQPTSEELHDLPGCAVCGKAADARGVLSCSVCHAVAQAGGTRHTIYCSRACYDAGHEKHVEAEHDCEAGSDCVQLMSAGVVVDGGAFACRECFEQKVSALFCSERCAHHNMEGHGRKHGVGGGGGAEMMAPLAEVVGSMLQKRHPGLEMEVVRG